MVGVPAAVQSVGLRYGLIVLSYPVFTVILTEVMIPVYRRHQINSVFDFVQTKFGNGAKTLALIIYNLQASGFSKNFF